METLYKAYTSLIQAIYKVPEMSVGGPNGEGRKQYLYAWIKWDDWGCSVTAYAGWKHICQEET